MNTTRNYSYWVSIGKNYEEEDSTIVEFRSDFVGRELRDRD